MLLLRAYYATAYLSLGAVLPILALSLEARGFTAGQYALLLALQPILRALAPPFWGALSDRLLGTARLLRVNAWLAALAMGALSANLSAAWTVAAFVLWSVVSTSFFPLADAGAHALLRERASEFGRIRVFGSLGFLLAAVTVGSIGVGEGFALPFALAGCAYLLAGGFAAGFPAHAPFVRPGLGAELRAHLRQRQVWLLLSGVGVYYFGHGIYDVFYGPHVARATGLSPRTISLLWALGVLVEIPVVAWAPRWLRLRSGGRLLGLAALVAAARWALLSQVSAGWQVWLLQPLHGVTFGLWYLAFVHENQRMAPPQLRATVQGVGAAAQGGGMALGTVVAGQLFERYASGSVFVLAAVSALGAGFLYVARERWGGDRPIELAHGAE